MKDKNVKSRFNSFGQKIFNHLYQGKSKKDIISFIENVVFRGNDYLKKDRNNFLNKSILPNNKKTASQNIFDVINRTLC